MKRVRLFAVLALAVSAVAAQAQTTVFQIGKTDRNYSDLNMPQPQDYAGSFPQDVKYVVGQSSPARDFSGIHPGPSDVWGGSRRHPFVIEFPLEDAGGGYELKIDLVDTHANAAPRLRVDVNGSSVERSLEPGTGDASLVRPEGGKPRTLRFVLGPNYLKKGSNRILLEVTSGSWLLYDAITLSRLPAGRSLLELSVKPTMYFVERDGKLLQELAATISGAPRDERVKIDVRAGVDPVGTATLGEPTLGMVSGAVYAEDTPKPRQLTITATAGGQTRTVSLTQRPRKKWQIFVAPSVHTDIGYTDVQDKVIDVHNRNTDLALELVREFPLYHWNLESSWAAQMWLRNVPAYRHRELFKAARERRIGIESSYLNMLSGLCTEEELIRNMYYSARLHRQFGVPFESYTITDAPSHVWSVPSILSGAGIRCLSVGVNQTRAPLFKKEIHKKSPFWWEGPDGGRVLTWFTAGYSQAGRIGLNDDFDRMRTAVAADLAWWDKRDDYPYDAILLHGAYSDNVSGTKHIAQSITEWSRHYAYPKVILCSNDDFFKHIEKNFADKIPTVRGGGGSWWEDGAGSTAVETAINRVTHQDIIAAETAWALVKQTNPEAAVPQERFNTAWDNILLYDEHTWGAYNSISAPNIDFVARQWAVKAAYATTAKQISEKLLDRGLHTLGRRVNAPAGSVLVFNPSGRARTGTVEAEIPRGMRLADEGGPIPQQITRQDLLVPVGVTFMARDVPAVGYRTYRLVPGNQQETAAPRRFDGKTFENDYYRLTFDPETGGIASLFDKQLGKELVDAGSPYKLGQLIYAAGGEEKKGETRVECPNPNKITFHSPEQSGQEATAAGPVFSTVTSSCQMHMFPRARMEVVLYEKDRRIDLNFRLTKHTTCDKEAVYIAFPFAGAAPQFRYEVGGGNVRPNQDHFPGACRDWFSIQRWVTMNGKDRAVALSPVDTPLITLCQMTPGNWLEELPITNGTVFAYTMNNYWFTNYKASQDGDFVFRFSLASDKVIDPAAASLFGESVQAPMRTCTVVPARQEAERNLPPVAGFCSVEPDSVMVTAVKPADDGKGLIVRLRETSGTDSEARITVAFPGITKASRCNLVERCQTELPMSGGKISLKLKGYGMGAIRLE